MTRVSSNAEGFPVAAAAGVSLLPPAGGLPLLSFFAILRRIIGRGRPVKVTPPTVRRLPRLRKPALGLKRRGGAGIPVSSAGRRVCSAAVTASRKGPSMKHAIRLMSLAACSALMTLTPCPAWAQAEPAAAQIPALPPLLPEGVPAFPGAWGG